MEDSSIELFLFFIDNPPVVGEVKQKKQSPVQCVGFRQTKGTENAIHRFLFNNYSRNNTEHELQHISGKSENCSHFTVRELGTENASYLDSYYL